MIKKTLMAIALLAFVTSAYASLTIDDDIPAFYWHKDKGYAVKSELISKPVIQWPYTINYQALTICTIPIYMHVGMYVQIENCDDKKIILEQLNCSDIGKNSTNDFPCYQGCVDELKVKANFDVKMGASLHIKDGVPAIPNGDHWSAYYDNGVDVVPGDGDYHSVKLCVKAWGVNIAKSAPGEEVQVGSVDVTVKPN